MPKSQRFALNEAVIDEIKAGARHIDDLVSNQDAELAKLRVKTNDIKDPDERKGAFQAVEYSANSLKITAEHLKLDNGILKGCGILHLEQVGFVNELDDDIQEIKKGVVTKSDLQKIESSMEALKKSQEKFAKDLSPMLEKFNEAGVLAKYRKGIITIVIVTAGVLASIKTGIIKW